MKRSCTKVVLGYSKPQKYNQFSPSPIKRYQNRSGYVNSDNKENFGHKLQFKK